MNSKSEMGTRLIESDVKVQDDRDTNESKAFIDHLRVLVNCEGGWMISSVKEGNVKAESKVSSIVESSNSDMIVNDSNRSKVVVATGTEGAAGKP